MVYTFREADNATEINVSSAPPGDRNQRADAEAAAREFVSQPIQLLSRINALFLDFRAPGYVGPLASLVLKVDEQPEPPLFSEPRPGELDIALPDELLKWLYGNIVEDQGLTPKPS